MMGRTCIIIPALNEEENILRVIKGIRQFSDADIIVIDDGSRDLTGQKAAAAGALVVSHPFNMGYGVTLQTGYKYALRKNYEFLVQIDGDGQHDPKYIPELLKPVENGECDLVVGSRFLGETGYEAGLLKSIGIAIFRHMIMLMNKEKVTDPTSGYQCLNKRVFKACTEDLFPRQYPDANVLIILHHLGFKIREVPVTMMPHPEGRSMHQGLFKLTFYFFSMFLSFFITLIQGRKH